MPNSTRRDAVGCLVEVRAGARDWTVQLTAGGGFQTSSQQQILVGLGACDSIDQLTVRRPDESEQAFRELHVDCELLLIQGRSERVIGPRLKIDVVRNE